MDHDHGTMDHGMHATSTSPSSAAATGAAMDHGDHGGHGAMNSCKISMLWNWNTIDSCFISSTWHVTSRGMFAGSCIGVVLLGMTLELLRRSVKEYDRFLIRRHEARSLEAAAQAGAASKDGGSGSGEAGAGMMCRTPAFKPNVFEQAVRALLHMCQFAVAYFLMLLAMYYNGYIIICIFLGSYIGAFIFQWEKLTSDRTSAANEATVCCG